MKMFHDKRAVSSKVIWIMIALVIALVIGYISIQIASKSGKTATTSLESAGACGFVSGKGYCSVYPVTGENCYPHDACPKEEKASVEEEALYMKTQKEAFDAEKKRLKDDLGIQWSDLTAQQKKTKMSEFFGYCCETE